MRTVTTDDFSSPIARRSVVTIGNFDGVHRGHQEIFRQVIKMAKEQSALSVVITFNPHPLRVLRPDDRRFRLITTQDQKQALISESGIELLLVIPFSNKFASITAEQFVHTVLHGYLGACFVVIGHDYAFGRNREGNELFLTRMGQKLGFGVFSLEPVGDADLLFSSSTVRRLVSSGDMSRATHILGRCHSIVGSVIHGREIGRSLGFPTANIDVKNELIPCDGVYAVWVSVNDELLMGACSIGVNPTFDGGGHTVEVFLFDFEADLYGQNLVIHFVNRLRDVVNFPDVDALISQISTDVARARLILSAGLPMEQK